MTKKPYALTVLALAGVLCALPWLAGTRRSPAEAVAFHTTSASLVSTESFVPLASMRALAADENGASLREASARAVEPEAAPTRRTEVERAHAELKTQIDDALEGFLYVDHLLDQVQVFADLPVEPKADLDYDDEDAIAYRILGTPEGTSAHFLVGRGVIERDGQEFRFLQLEIETEDDVEPEFHHGALRLGPRVHLTLDYDSEGAPGALAIVTQRDVALRASRERGLDADRGLHVTGAGLRANFGSAPSTFSETFGLIDGVKAKGNRFPSVSPLRGDTDPDPTRVRTLLASLLRNRRAVDGSSSR
jgi:hypothetical protein